MKQTLCRKSTVTRLKIMRRTHHGIVHRMQAETDGLKGKGYFTAMCISLVRC